MGRGRKRGRGEEEREGRKGGRGRMERGRTEEKMR